MLESKSGKKALDVGQSLAGMLVAVVFQIISFILLTRVLGVSSFGVFISAVAIGLAISELVGLGSGENFIRVVAREKRAVKDALVHGVVLIALTFFVFVLPLAPLAAFYLAPETLFWPLTALIATEAVILRSALFCEHVYLGLEDYRLSALARIVVPAVRCICFLIVIFMFGGADLVTIIFTHILATLAAAILMLWHVFAITRSLPDQTKAARSRREWLGFGFPVALANLQRGLQFHGDKYLVTLMAGPEVGGIYAAGFRLVQMALLPVQAYMRTTYSGFFAAGRDGLSASIAYGKSIVLTALIIATVSSIAAYFGSYIVVFLLGEAYSASGLVMRMLCFILPLWALQYVLNDILMGADRVWSRISILLMANIVGVGLIVALAAPHGLYGVLGAVLLATLIAVCLLFGVIRFLTVKKNP